MSSPAHPGSYANSNSNSCSLPGRLITADEIRTARLDLIPLRVEHAADMAVVLGDPALHTFIGGSPDDAEMLRNRYRRMLAGSPDPGVSWCNWVVRLREGFLSSSRERSQVEGSSGLVGTVQATIGPGAEGPLAEIAWVIGTPWQGRGFASEAARGLADWLAAQGMRTLVAHVHPDHGASAAVAAAAGLAATGEVHDGEIRWEASP
ncbi:GNAT family N-acetyltransferase [Streptomyces sp. G44]|uniref:GNAT family N-acetyltransferase n=1 Tax=Streptomyces sp. G44 TaxID=2807632 RepID=UPI0019612C20|nr:GNAT family N-acetyltransferase [Streptomyces sp. G44]MBM7170504.1 GNAT family N-acetyltransferase [Streptomyces sp. G44]